MALACVTADHQWASRAGLRHAAWMRAGGSRCGEHGLGQGRDRLAGVTARLALGVIGVRARSTHAPTGTVTPLSALLADRQDVVGDGDLEGR